MNVLKTQEVVYVGRGLRLVFSGTCTSVRFKKDGILHLSSKLLNVNGYDVSVYLVFCYNDKTTLFCVHRHHSVDELFLCKQIDLIS